MKKKVVWIFFLIIMIVLTLGITYSFYTNFIRGTKNSVLITGEIYMNYTESNQINITNGIPMSKEEALLKNDNVFNFSISGKNTNTKHDIYYKISITNGDNLADKNRINPEDVVLYLTEGSNVLVNALRYTDLDNTGIYVDTIARGTTSEITRNYQLRMWIDENTVIGNTEAADYSIEEWNNAYISLKVNVDGNLEKMNQTLGIDSSDAYLSNNKSYFYTTISNFLNPLDEGLSLSTPDIMELTITSSNPDVSFTYSDNLSNKVTDLNSSLNLKYTLATNSKIKIQIFMIPSQDDVEADIYITLKKNGIIENNIIKSLNIKMNPYYKELKAIEDLVLNIANTETPEFIGTKLTTDTQINIRGINYWNGWYKITASDLSSYGLDLTHAPYIVKYTTGAVQSIPGEIIDSIPIHTYNYYGEGDYAISLEGLLSGVTNESTKNAVNWGEMTIGGLGTYDSEMGLQLGTNYATLAIDQSRPVNQKYSINVTVKGGIPQASTDFPKTIVAISETSASYLSWIGISNNYLHVYSFYSGSAKGSINQEQYNVSDPGFISFDLTNIRLNCSSEEIEDNLCDENNKRLVNFNNEYLNIQVTAERNENTNIYINGQLYKTIKSGSALLGYGTITIGDLRAGRNLKYIGSIYNFILYSETLSDDEVSQNWDYFKNELNID